MNVRVIIQFCNGDRVIKNEYGKVSGKLGKRVKVIEVRTYDDPFLNAYVKLTEQKIIEIFLDSNIEICDNQIQMYNFCKNSDTVYDGNSINDFLI